jgi:hypothetical protein
MELISSWEQRGYERGLEEGKRELLTILFQYLFNALPANLPERLEQFTSNQLNDLARALFSFKNLADLEAWLDSR